MIINLKDNEKLFLSKLNSNDFIELCEYLQGLAPATKQRFGPHKFDLQSIIDLYHLNSDCWGYIVRNAASNQIIAYAIVKHGYLEHDKPRLESYGLKLDKITDCTFAPSVADSWQGMGIGDKLLQFIIPEFKANGINRIILWGGVQLNNEKAVNYYIKSGFSIQGQFSYNGENYDMLREL